MDTYFSKIDRREAILKLVTRKLKAAGLQDFTFKSVRHALKLFDGGTSAYSSVCAGVSFGHHFEQELNNG